MISVSLLLASQMPLLESRPFVSGHLKAALNRRHKKRGVWGHVWSDTPMGHHSVCCPPFPTASTSGIWLLSFCTRCHSVGIKWGRNDPRLQGCLCHAGGDLGTLGDPCPTAGGAGGATGAPPMALQDWLQLPWGIAGLTDALHAAGCSTSTHPRRRACPSMFC